MNRTDRPGILNMPPQDGGSIGYCNLGSIFDEWSPGQWFGQHVSKLILRVDVKNAKKAARNLFPNKNGSQVQHASFASGTLDLHKHM